MLLIFAQLDHEKITNTEDDDIPVKTKPNKKGEKLKQNWFDINLARD